MNAEDEVLYSTDFLIIVDDLQGHRAYRVDSFNVDIRSATLHPVFNHGKTTKDFGTYAQFRLVNSTTSPGWLYEAAKQLVAEPTFKSYEMRDWESYHA